MGVWIYNLSRIWTRYIYYIRFVYFHESGILKYHSLKTFTYFDTLGKSGARGWVFTYKEVQCGKWRRNPRCDKWKFICRKWKRSRRLGNWSCQWNKCRFLWNFFAAKPHHEIIILYFCDFETTIMLFSVKQLMYCIVLI